MVRALSLAEGGRPVIGLAGAAPVAGSVTVVAGTPLSGASEAP